MFIITKFGENFEEEKWYQFKCLEQNSGSWKVWKTAGIHDINDTLAFGIDHVINMGVKKSVEGAEFVGGGFWHIKSWEKPQS